MPYIRIEWTKNDIVVAQLSTSSPISVTSASTSSFYPTLNVGSGLEINANYAKYALPF